MPPSQSYGRRCVACQYFPDDQTLRLRAGAGEDVIHLPSGLNRVACQRQEAEEEANPKSTWLTLSFTSPNKILKKLMENGFHPSLTLWDLKRDLAGGGKQRPIQVESIQLTKNLYLRPRQSHRRLLKWPIAMMVRSSLRIKPQKQPCRDTSVGRFCQVFM